MSDVETEAGELPPSLVAGGRRPAQADAGTAALPVRGRHVPPRGRHALDRQPGIQPTSLHARAANWLVAVVPAMVGLITGGYRIGYPPLWRDEAATKAISGRTVSQILATLPHDDVVHGAYYLVVHFFEALLGASVTVLRLPSLIAMAVACAFTGLVARRLAVLAGAPFATFTGLTAGVAFAIAPYMIRYAQEARSYGIVTMLATVATYLLLKAACDGRRWWIAYTVAVGLTGLFNLFGLLLLAPHGMSLFIASRRRDAAGRSARWGLPGLAGRRIAGIPASWLIAAASAMTALIALVFVASKEESGALAWLSAKPSIRGSFIALARNWAGSPRLAWPILALAAGGIVAGLVADRRRPPLTPGVVALPWLVIPPVLLISVSQIHPMYDERYVEYCLPALAILVAWGITWLARLAVATPLRRVHLAWLPSTATMVTLLLLLLPADAAIRLPSARPDNLKAESRIIARNEKPGDIVFYIPLNDRVVSMPFPGPWHKLRDIALAKSPVASDNLYGTDVSLAELLARFIHVTRVWVIASSIDNYMWSSRATPLDKEEVRLISGMRKIRRWRDGDTMLTLYAVRQLPDSAPRNFPSMVAARGVLQPAPEAPTAPAPSVVAVNSAESAQDFS